VDGLHELSTYRRIYTFGAHEVDVDVDTDIENETDNENENENVNANTTNPPPAGQHTFPPPPPQGQQAPISMPPVPHPHPNPHPHLHTTPEKNSKGVANHPVRGRIKAYSITHSIATSIPTIPQPCLGNWAKKVTRAMGTSCVWY